MKPIKAMGALGIAIAVLTIVYLDQQRPQPTPQFTQPQQVVTNAPLGERPAEAVLANESDASTDHHRVTHTDRLIEQADVSQPETPR
jgi:hypothetical protein